jgi:hypothetical protein
MGSSGAPSLQRRRQRGCAEPRGTQSKRNVIRASRVGTSVRGHDVEESQFAALISALHRCTQQKLPVCVVGAGLPQLRGRAGKAKSYAERLFDYPEVGPLARDAARQALVKPAANLNVEYVPAAVERIISETMIWSPNHGDTAFTVPLFDEFMKRIMRGTEW